ncbi:hypothetical protein ACJVDH_18380 [Pedobacter sp. AW1-32]|uniref:hypothetical protein n=1 Tax=Pedobacter sp. AW1-32 TaxID=3383026 RepID=UPI003FEEDD16
MAEFSLTKIKEYDAHGGPSNESQGGDGHMKTSTRSGIYVIHSIEKHVSYGRYAFWSGLPWGTEMTLKGDVTMVKHRGTWQKLTGINSEFAKFKNRERELSQYLKQSYFELYNKNEFPTSWVFNDFGHISVKYFKDANGNWKMDGKESIMSDFIHTTPVDEASTARQLPVTLSESHGCIHVKPHELDIMIGNGYLKKGLRLEVHNYTEKNIASTLKRKTGKAPYEVHFYPGKLKIAVYKVELKN